MLSCLISYFILKRYFSTSSHELWKTFTNCIIEYSNVLSHFTHGILSLKTGYLSDESEMACLLGRSLYKLNITKYGALCPPFSLQAVLFFPM